MYYDGVLLNIFVYMYIMLLTMCLIVSLALPLDRAKPCFFISITLFGVITIFAIFGMMFYLINAGFFPEHIIYDQYTYQWIPQGDHNFSWLVLAGTIMLSVYLVPIFLRPVDFLDNIGGYIIGLLSYLILIPMFSNVFTIYAMANLHDISWGNRPKTTGTDNLTSNVNI